MARLRVGGCQNQGTINFLELLQHLRPFFWRVGHKKCRALIFYSLNIFFQAISSIREHFPDSKIIKRLHILSQPDAESFFQQWPTLCREEEAKNDQFSVLKNAFHESPTREAFSSFAAQIHGMNQFMESTAEKLTVLTRRTEPFSPSKRISQPMSNSSNHSPLTPNLFPPALPATSISRLSSPQAPSPSLLSFQSASEPSNLPTSGPLPSNPQPLLQSAQIITSNGAQVYSPTTTSGFPQPGPASLSSVRVLSPTEISSTNQTVYHVLPLSPFITFGQPIHTSHDLVLPPTSAFLSSTYPVFTTVDCTWQYILDRVVNPSSLWSSYSPGSLGDYTDVKSIWQAWDEGEYIKDVGHKPALRAIDTRWGNLENQETQKRKYPSWRPRNDNKVHVHAQFLFTEILLVIGPQDMVKFLFFYLPHQRENQVRT